MSEQFKIEKDVPLPKPEAADSLTGAFRKMEVGHSVLLPPGAITATGRYSAASRAGIKITCRIQEDGYLRIWRKS